MSYLLQHLRRVSPGGRRRRAARLDETTLLNLPDFDGGAHVHCFVEDTSQRRRRGHVRIKLRIADCVHAANLEFSLDSPESRQNALYKANTLIAALNRFRDALAEEVALAAQQKARKEA